MTVAIGNMLNAGWWADSDVSQYYAHTASTDELYSGALDGMAAMIAASATFQGLVGAEDAAEALSSVIIGPQEDIDDTLTYAVVDVLPIARREIASATMQTDGAVWVYLQIPVSETDAGNLAAERNTYLRAAGAIWLEIEAASRGGAGVGMTIIEHEPAGGDRWPYKDDKVKTGVSGNPGVLWNEWRVRYWGV